MHMEFLPRWDFCVPTQLLNAAFATDGCTEMGFLRSHSHAGFATDWLLVSQDWLSFLGSGFDAEFWLLSARLDSETDLAARQKHRCPLMGWKMLSNHE